MKYSQKFEDYNIKVDFKPLYGYDWQISVRSVSSWEVMSIVKSKDCPARINSSQSLGVNAKESMKMVNAYQEAISLANVKELNEELLIELGYTAEE